MINELKCGGCQSKREKNVDTRAHTERQIEHRRVLLWFNVVVLLSSTGTECCWCQHINKNSSKSHTENTHHVVTRLTRVRHRSWVVVVVVVVMVRRKWRRRRVVVVMRYIEERLS